MKKLLLFTFFSFFSFVFIQKFPPIVHAIDFETNDTVHIPQNRIIDQSVVATGESLRIEGTIQGDLYCAGKNITISGSVSGDVLCAGETIKINGSVGGDVRVAAKTITIVGTVFGNTTSFGENVTVEPKSMVNGEILVGAETFNLQGSVSRDVSGWVKNAYIDGIVGRHLSLTVDKLSVGNAASIAGKLSYDSKNTATIDTSASISGSINHSIPKDNTAVSMNRPSLPHRWNGGIYGLVTLLLGGLLVAFAKERIKIFSDKTDKSGLLFFMMGVALLVIIPIILVILFITILGIPIAIVGTFIFLLLYFFGRALTAILVGKYIIRRFMPQNTDSVGWWLVSGVVSTWAIFSIPIFGGIVSFFSSIFGIGLMAYFLLSLKKNKIM